MATILGMRLRRTPPHLLIDTYLRLKHRNKNPDMTRIETVYLANRGTIHTAEDLVDRVLAEQIQ